MGKTIYAVWRQWNTTIEKRKTHIRKNNCTRKREPALEAKDGQTPVMILRRAGKAPILALKRESNFCVYPAHWFIDVTFFVIYIFLYDFVEQLSPRFTQNDDDYDLFTF